MNRSLDRQVYRVVGVVHLPPLPGSVLGQSTRTWDTLLDRVRRDATSYAEAGVDAIIVENFGDVPFTKGPVEPDAIAAMTVATRVVREATMLPIGVNILRNDVEGAVSVASFAGGSFVRANVYVGASVTDQGLIEGRADKVQQLMRRLDSPIDVWADVDVKHATPLAYRPIAELAEDAVERGLAAAVIVTGRATGAVADFDDLMAVRAAVPDTPLYVGSGATIDTIAQLLALADGVIIGTAAKHDGIVTNPVDPLRTQALVNAAKS